MPQVAVSSLVIPNEETVIPLLRHDQFLVSEYATAMRHVYGGTWGDFPSIKIDQDNLVLCGVHRVLAAQEVGVRRAPAERVKCETPAERILIAAGDNATHGARWRHQDVANLALVAERFGVPKDMLATSLRVPVTKIERIPVTTVARRTEAGMVEERVYVKRGVRSFVKDRVLSEAEEASMRSIATPLPADRLLVQILRL